jgi:hypothetical protein
MLLDLAGVDAYPDLDLSLHGWMTQTAIWADNRIGHRPVCLVR